MQVVALHVADQQTVEVELVQVAAAVVQVIQVLASRQGQRSEVTERIVFVGQRALRRLFFYQAVTVTAEVEGRFGNAKLLPIVGSSRKLEAVDRLRHTRNAEAHPG